MILVIFLTTEISYAQIPNVSAAEPNKINGSSISVSEFEIPEELGSIQAFEFSKDRDQPFVIYIQDAHAVVDAQAKIRSLIRYLNEQYGIHTVFLEGTSGKLEPAILRAFPDEGIKRTVFKEYLERGELTGAQMAAILDAPGVDFYGIEDRKLYETNYEAYLRSQEKSTVLQSEIRHEKQELDQQRKTIFSPALNRFHETVQAFYDEDLHLLDLVKSLRNDVIARRPEADEAIFDDLPNLSRLLVSLPDEKGDENLHVSIRKMAEDFKQHHLLNLEKEKTMLFNEQLQAYFTGQIDEGAFLKTLVDLSSELGLEVHLTPLMHELLGEFQTLSMIQGTRLFDELKSYLQEEQARLIQNDAQKQLAEQYEHLRLLEKLSKLELEREDLDQVIKEVLRHPEGRSPKGSLDSLLQPAFDFYSTVLARDEAFHRNLKDQMQRLKVDAAVVVAGGFHAKGFSTQFQEDDFAYAVVTPKMSSLNGHESYRSLMEGDFSYRSFMKETFYDAFIRHAALQLVEELDQPNFGKILKLWRDEIIRNLSAQGRIAESHKFTKYVDLLYRHYYDQYGHAMKVTENREEVLGAMEKELGRFREEKIADFLSRNPAALNPTQTMLHAVQPNLVPDEKLFGFFIDSETPLLRSEARVNLEQVMKISGNDQNLAGHGVPEFDMASALTDRKIAGAAQDLNKITAGNAGQLHDRQVSNGDVHNVTAPAGTDVLGIGRQIKTNGLPDIAESFTAVAALRPTPLQSRDGSHNKSIRTPAQNNGQSHRHTPLGDVRNNTGNLFMRQRNPFAARSSGTRRSETRKTPASEEVETVRSETRRIPVHFDEAIEWKSRTSDKSIVLTSDTLGHLQSLTRLARKLDAELMIQIYLKDGKVAAVDYPQHERQIAVVHPLSHDENEVSESIRYYWTPSTAIGSLMASLAAQEGVLESLKALGGALDQYQAAIELYSLDNQMRYSLNADELKNLESIESALGLLKDIAAVEYAATRFFGPTKIAGNLAKKNLEKGIDYNEVILIHNHPNEVPSPPSAIDEGRGLGDIYIPQFWTGEVNGIILDTQEGDELVLLHESEINEIRKQEYLKLYNLYWYRSGNPAVSEEPAAVWDPVNRTFKRSIHEEKVMQGLRNLAMEVPQGRLLLTTRSESRSEARLPGGQARPEDLPREETSIRVNKAIDLVEKTLKVKIEQLQKSLQKSSKGRAGRLENKLGAFQYRLKKAAENQGVFLTDEDLSHLQITGYFYRTEGKNKEVFEILLSEGATSPRKPKKEFSLSLAFKNPHRSGFITEDEVDRTLTVNRHTDFDGSLAPVIVDVFYDSHGEISALFEEWVQGPTVRLAAKPELGNSPLTLSEIKEIAATVTAYGYISSGGSDYSRFPNDIHASNVMYRYERNTGDEKPVLALVDSRGQKSGETTPARFVHELVTYYVEGEEYNAVRPVENDQALAVQRQLEGVVAGFLWGAKYLDPGKEETVVHEEAADFLLQALEGQPAQRTELKNEITNFMLDHFFIDGLIPQSYWDRFKENEYVKAQLSNVLGGDGMNEIERNYASLKRSEARSSGTRRSEARKTPASEDDVSVISLSGVSVYDEEMDALLEIYQRIREEMINGGYEVGQEFDDEQQFMHEAERLGDSSFAVEDQGEIAGFILNDPYPDAGDKYLEVEIMGVHPDSRGQGLGARLLDASEGLARLLGKTGLWLEVDVDNVPAMTLYESLGFKRVLGDGNEYGQVGGYVSMTKILAAAVRSEARSIPEAPNSEGAFLVANQVPFIFPSIQTLSPDPESKFYVGKRVEPALVNAVRAFMKRNIRTASSSANREDISLGYAEIIVDYRSMSAKNQRVLFEELPQRSWKYGQVGVEKYTLFPDEFAMIKFPINEATSTPELSDFAEQIANLFGSQEAPIRSEVRALTRSQVYEQFRDEFDEKGIALTDHARKLALDLYQRAIDIFAEQAPNVVYSDAGTTWSNEYMETQLSRFDVPIRVRSLAGSLWQNEARLGVFPPAMSYEKAYNIAVRDKHHDLRSETFSKQFPSDIDILLAMPAAPKDNRSNFLFKLARDSMRENLKPLLEQIFRETGILIHPDPEFRYASANISEAVDGGLKRHLQSLDSGLRSEAREFNPERIREIGAELTEAEAKVGALLEIVRLIEEEHPLDMIQALTEQGLTVEDGSPLLVDFDQTRDLLNRVEGELDLADEFIENVSLQIVWLSAYKMEEISENEKDRIRGWERQFITLRDTKNELQADFDMARGLINAHLHLMEPEILSSRSEARATVEVAEKVVLERLLGDRLTRQQVQVIEAAFNSLRGIYPIRSLFTDPQWFRAGARKQLKQKLSVLIKDFDQYENAETAGYDARGLALHIYRAIENNSQVSALDIQRAYLDRFTRFFETLDDYLGQGAEGEDQSLDNALALIADALVFERRKNLLEMAQKEAARYEPQTAASLDISVLDLGDDKKARTVYEDLNRTIRSGEKKKSRSAQFKTIKLITSDFVSVTKWFLAGAWTLVFFFIKIPVLLFKMIQIVQAIPENIRDYREQVKRSAPPEVRASSNIPRAVREAGPAKRVVNVRPLAPFSLGLRQLNGMYGLHEPDRIAEIPVKSESAGEIVQWIEMELLGMGKVKIENEGKVTSFDLQEHLAAIFSYLLRRIAISNQLPFLNALLTDSQPAVRNRFLYELLNPQTPQSFMDVTDERKRQTVMRAGNLEIQNRRIGIWETNFEGVDFDLQIRGDDRAALEQIIQDLVSTTDEHIRGMMEHEVIFRSEARADSPQESAESVPLGPKRDEARKSEPRTLGNVLIQLIDTVDRVWREVAGGMMETLASVLWLMEMLWRGPSYWIQAYERILDSDPSSQQGAADDDLQTTDQIDIHVHRFVELAGKIMDHLENEWERDPALHELQIIHDAYYDAEVSEARLMEIIRRSDLESFRQQFQRVSADTDEEGFDDIHFRRLVDNLFIFYEEINTSRSEARSSIAIDAWNWNQDDFLEIGSRDVVRLPTKVGLHVPIHRFDENQPQTILLSPSGLELILIYRDGSFQYLIREDDPYEAELTDVISGALKPEEAILIGRGSESRSLPSEYKNAQFVRLYKKNKGVSAYHLHIRFDAEKDELILTDLSSLGTYLPLEEARALKSTRDISEDDTVVHIEIEGDLSVESLEQIVFEIDEVKKKQPDVLYRIVDVHPVRKSKVFGPASESAWVDFDDYVTDLNKKIQFEQNLVHYAAIAQERSALKTEMPRFETKTGEILEIHPAFPADRAVRLLGRSRDEYASPFEKIALRYELQHQPKKNEFFIYRYPILDEEDNPIPLRPIRSEARVLDQINSQFERGAERLMEGIRQRDLPVLEVVAGAEFPDQVRTDLRGTIENGVMNDSTDVIHLQARLMYAGLSPSLLADEVTAELQERFPDGFDSIKIEQSLSGHQQGIRDLLRNHPELLVSVMTNVPQQDPNTEALLAGVLNEIRQERSIVMHSPDQNLGPVWRNLARLSPVNYRNNAHETAKRIVESGMDENLLMLFVNDLGVDSQSLGVFGILADQIGPLEKMDSRMARLAMTAIAHFFLQFATLEKQLQDAMIQNPALIRELMPQVEIHQFIQFDGQKGGMAVDLLAFAESYKAIRAAA